LNDREPPQKGVLVNLAFFGLRRTLKSEFSLKLN